MESNFDQIKQFLEEIPEDEELLNGYLGQSGACEEHNCIDQIGSIDSETLVLYGKNDLIMSPKKSLEMAEKIPNSKVRGFDGAGHGFWRERQKEVDELVMEFLSS